MSPRAKTVTSQIRALAYTPARTRFLTCTSCKDTLEVGEVPFGWINPWTYQCGECSMDSAVYQDKQRLHVVRDET
jgi:hypothetical protein